MIWAVLAAAAGSAVILAGAWWLGRPRPLPDGETAEGDGEGFRTQFRGYRMDQVDDVIDRLEARIARLDEELDPGPPGPAGPPIPAAPRMADPSPPVAPTPTSTATASPQPTGTPWPFRRADLVAPAVYLLISAYLLINLLGGVTTRYLSQGVQDQQLYEWMFGAVAQNTLKLSNPLFSDLQNAPDGVNLMANTAMLGVSIPLTPLTVLAGPQWTFVLVELLGLTLTATAWYWLFRRYLPAHPALVTIGGGLCAFAPGLVSHANGHPNFILQALIPLIIDQVIRLARGADPVRHGLILGGLVAWQIFVGEELLLIAAIALGIGLLTLAAGGGVSLRRLMPGVGIGAALTVGVVAVPLWWQFAGPQSYGSIWHPPAGNDLASLWGRATRSLGADPWAAAALSMNRTEENAFFGIPLLLAAVIVVVVLRKQRLVRALAVVAVVCLWLSLGERVTLHGRDLGLPGPWALAGRLPLIDNVLPTRFALAVIPVLAVLLILGAERLRLLATERLHDRPLALGIAVAACVMVLVPVIPTPLVADDKPAVPVFFTDGSWRPYLEGGTLQPIPGAYISDLRVVDWQAASDWGFRYTAGYFVGPDGSEERVGQYGAPPTAFSQWLRDIATSNVVATADDVARAQFVDDLRRAQVDALVLPDDRASAGALLQSLTPIFGAPDRVGGVFVWDIRDLTLPK